MVTLRVCLIPSSVETTQLGSNQYVGILTQSHIFSILNLFVRILKKTETSKSHCAFPPLGLCICFSSALSAG